MSAAEPLISHPDRGHLPHRRIRVLVWQRTNIGGDVIPHYDFSASDSVAGCAVGRISRLPHQPNKGKWRWSMTHCPLRGRIDYQQLPRLYGLVDTKATAVERVKWAYEIVLDAAAQSRKSTTDCDDQTAAAG